MEICPRPGMGRNGASHVSNQVKAESAALGFRIKSGWAAAVLLRGPVRSLRLCDSGVIDLSDTRFSETSQPYHAAMGKLQTDTGQIGGGLRNMRRVRGQPITTLHQDNRSLHMRASAVL